MYLSNEENKDRILIVDDEDSVRTLFALCLCEKYACSEAASFTEAMAKLAETEYALVITDMIMPGLSGTELLRKVLEKYPQTAVIMVSGIDRSQRALDVVRLGAFDYLIKPCDLDVLEMTVERALERRRLLVDASRSKAALETRNEELVRGKAELQRLQAQIVHSEKMASLGQLAAGIAHELNNPVGYIHGNIEILSRFAGDIAQLLDYYDAAPLPESIKQGAQEIKKKIDYAATFADLNAIIGDCLDGARRISGIVQNLRTFSRLDEAEFAKTDVHEGIDSSLRLLSRYYGAENLKLIFDYGRLPLIDAFSGQLNQVWMNLLANAAQAVGTKKGEVKITTDTTDKNVFISIKDTGDGIAPEHLTRIFDPFFTTKPVGEGTGLGLSISFGIVERHGGTIKVETAVGEGSTFVVALPIQIQIADAN